MQYQGQSAAAKQQDKVYETNLQNTKTSTFERYDAINKRVIQEKAAADQQLAEAQIEGIQARGAARTAATESGVTGLSVTNVLRDMYSKNARYARNTTVNFGYSRDALVSEGRSARAQGQSQVNSVERGTRPSPFAAVLNIFGQAANTLAQAS